MRLACAIRRAHVCGVSFFFWGWLCRLLCRRSRWLGFLGHGAVLVLRRWRRRSVGLLRALRCLSGVRRGLTWRFALALGRVVGCSRLCRGLAVVWRRVRRRWFGRWLLRGGVGFRSLVALVLRGWCRPRCRVAVSVGWVLVLGLLWLLRSGWGCLVWSFPRGVCRPVGVSFRWVAVGLFGCELLVGSVRCPGWLSSRGFSFQFTFF